jgi:hypothetical protein
MPDYPGAEEAIKQRVRDNWSTTPVMWDGDPKPPTTIVGDDGIVKPTPWVWGEITNTHSPLVGAGLPGNQLWIYDGLIGLHVFVPADTTDSLAKRHAWDLGEIFRVKLFYNEVDGFGVRTWSPRIGRGGRGDDAGNWSRASVTIPFEYYHRG